MQTKGCHHWWYVDWNLSPHFHLSENQPFDNHILIFYFIFWKMLENNKKYKMTIFNYRDLEF
jgi:hypothetical protein